MKTKLFCIGFHKTGTTSLAMALKKLGYNTTGPNGTHDNDISTNATTLALNLIDKFDAFLDNPWPILYKELDRHYPNSKFILTVRDSDSWIESQIKYFGHEETPMRRWIYGAGCPIGNEMTYIKRFERHNKEVINYFSNKCNNQLLVMNITKGDDWIKLCPFLGMSIPFAKFPHLNITDK